MINDDDYDEDGNKIRRHTGNNKPKHRGDDDDDILDDIEELDDEDLTDEELAMMDRDRDDDDDDEFDLVDGDPTKEDLDGTYYSQYTEEADLSDEEESLDGFTIEG